MYVQVFNTIGTNSKIENNLYAYENDTLKILYSFWSEKGLMSFAVYNKLDKPLYIDWKKSSYITNTNKFNYWVDEEITRSMAVYGSYYYIGPSIMPGSAVSASSSASAGVSSTKKIERITFVPPKSNYYRSQFYILPIEYFKFDGIIESRVVPRNDKPNRKTKVLYKSYLKDNSPLIFRNFLTFSLTEDFKNEFYIDNEFYICKIQEMDKRHFEYYKRDKSIKFGNFYVKDENGIPIKFSNFENGWSFYLYKQW